MNHGIGHVIMQHIFTSLSSSLYMSAKLVHGTGLAGLSFKFFFLVPPGTGTDSAR